jgi:hypothetical protein
MVINPKLVRVSRLTDPMKGRPKGAWVISYHSQTFITDVGGGNPQPFTRGAEPREAIESRSRARPPETGFDVKSREDIARELRINPALVDLMQRNDPNFPAPILSFREGPIWSADAIERWEPNGEPPEPVPPRDGSASRA